MNPSEFIGNNSLRISGNIREVLRSWRYGEILDSWQGLAQDPQYSAWAPDLYRAAKEHFNSEDWNKLFPDFYRRGKAFQQETFNTHSNFLREISLLNSNNADHKLLVSLDGRLNPIYLGTGEKKNVQMSEFIGRYIPLNQDPPYISETEMTALAAAITYSLPVFPKALRGLEANLTRNGCYIKPTK